MLFLKRKNSIMITSFKYSFVLIALFAFKDLAFSQATEYRNYDIESKKNLTELTPDEKKEAIVLLLDQNSSELIYNKDGELEEYNFIHRIIKLNDASQIEKINKLYIPVGPTRELVTVRARTTRKDGKVFEMYKGDMKQITEEGHQYSILAAEGLEQDAEFEYFYLIKTNANNFFTERVKNGSYIKHLKLEVISPKNLLFEHKSYNGMPDVKDTVINDKNYCILELFNIPPVEEEKYTSNKAQFPRTELKLSNNTVKGTNKILTFTHAAKNYYGNMHNIDSKSQKAVDKIYDELKLKKVKDPDEKIILIENYLKSNFGISSSMPYSLAEACEKKILSEFYLNLLTIQLLDKSGIENEMVMTTDKSDAVFDPSIETWNYLTEIIIYIPSTKKYLCPYDFGTRYGMVPSEYTNQKGLFIKTIAIGETKSALSSVKFIEPMPKENNYDNLELLLQADLNTENVKIKLTRSIFGYSALNYRPYYFYSSEEKRTEVVEPILNLGLTGANITNSVIANWDLNTDQINKPFECKADIEVKSLLEKAGNEYLLKIGLCIGPQAELYQEKQRRYPANMRYPHKYKRILTVIIPDGYTLKGLDKLKMDMTVLDGNDKTAGFTSDYRLENNKLIVEINEFYAKEEYPVSQFESLRKVINAAADFNKLNILFSKKN